MYDWEPSVTVNKNSCTTTTFSLTAKGFGISIGGTVCPSKISPWNLAGTKSGAVWQGIEQGQDYEAAVGVQADHNPPSASASYNSPFKLTWGPWPP